MDLLRFEARITSVTIPLAMARLAHTERWNLKKWRLAHQIIFDPVYDWAGKLRTTNIKKEDSSFIDKDRIEHAADLAFKGFYERNSLNGDLIQGLQRLSKTDFCR